MTGRIEFDEAFYLRLYPDIQKAGVDPYEHFIHHGRVEGRMGVRPLLEQVVGAVAFDNDKATILIVSHEASLTGAPILSLNLVKALGQKYNVVSLLLGGGPLTEEFCGASVLVAGPVLRRYSSELVGDAVAQLCERYAFRFALVNSVESGTSLEALARRSIPTVALIHEFASYTRPSSIFRDAFFWADEVVFSTRMTYEDAVTQHPELAKKHIQILPQGRCEMVSQQLGGEAHNAELARVRAALRPIGVTDDTLLVLGLGSVQIRKGVDLFIDCASRVKARGGPDCRFVWIGKGYEPGNDLAYSVYLADQVKRAGLEGYVSFMNDTPEIEEVYRAADVVLLTSRLDPLPNVAIDSMSHGLPLVCFASTTGVADVLADNGMAHDCVVSYLDTAAMAEKVIELARSPALRDEVGEKLRKIAEEVFNFASYASEIQAIGLVACEKAEREQETTRDIQSSGICRTDFLGTPIARGDEFDAIRWNYLRAWTTGLWPRKPFPGFQPAVYEDLRGKGSADPLTEYLAAGRPDGPWRHEVITEKTAVVPVRDVRVGLHIHAYYPDLLPEILERLSRNKSRPDLLISVPSTDVLKIVEPILGTYSGKVLIEVVPNRGRDIGPLLTAFGTRIIREYDFIGHLHTKKTVDIADTEMANSWRRFLLENLVGGAHPMMDIVLGQMNQDCSIGLVFPDDPNVIGWGKNKPHALDLCPRLGIKDELPENFVFPVGAMFWSRVDAIRPMFDAGLDWDDYPCEPLPYDGSMLHALERLLPFVSAATGRRCVLTNVEGVSR